ncbi:MAG: leucine-rich repeat protein, partial [Clostridia bacterium]|nr:leucine-rich repeat protein [Clostridia bacterium]
MKTKRMLSLLLSVLLTVTLLPGLALPAMAAGDSGTCGDSVLWTLDGAGTLTISADEEAEAECWMDDYSETEHAPWYESRASVKEVIVDEGVLSLGERALDGCFALKTVSLPDSLEYVGREVFRGCDSLSGIVVSSGNDYFYSEDGVLLGEDCLYRYPPAKED